MSYQLTDNDLYFNIEEFILHLFPTLIEDVKLIQDSISYQGYINLSELTREGQEILRGLCFPLDFIDGNSLLFKMTKVSAMNWLNILSHSPIAPVVLELDINSSPIYLSSKINNTLSVFYLIFSFYTIDKIEFSLFDFEEIEETLKEIINSYPDALEGKGQLSIVPKYILPNYTSQIPPKTLGVMEIYDNKYTVIQDQNGKFSTNVNTGISDFADLVYAMEGV